MTARREPHVTGRPITLDDTDLLDFLRLFHGHVGPFVVLGHRLGLRALEALGARKYFGLDVTVAGPRTTPYTCLIDGLQTGTGCTMGKGNIVVSGEDPPVGKLFLIRAAAEERALTIEVPDSVRALFAGWMRSGLSEDELCARVRDAPASALWDETCSG